MPPACLRAYVFVAFAISTAGCSEFVDRVPDTGPDTATPCTSTCSTAGLLECQGDGQRRVCVEAEQGCLEWQPAAACPDGTVCREAGSCGADGCGADGLRVCRGSGGYEECRLEPSGFLAWGGFEACPSGTTCASEGECVTSEPECPSVGLKRCALGLVETCALIDGALLFGPGEACPEGELCRGDGVCGRDLCQDGDTRCGEAGLEVCEADSTGFLAFGAGTPCPGAEGVCRDGRCGIDTCPSAGATVCTTEGLQQTCEVAADGFLTFDGGVPCPAAQSCRDGQCGEDACPALGATDCASGGLRQCQAEGPFLAWSGPTPCTGGVCADGACVLHQCPGVGAPKCADETHVSLCQEQPNGAFAWGPLIPCPGEGSVCRAAGVCGKDSCAEDGLVGCLGTTATRGCGYYGDPFLTWGPGDDCAAGQECRGGVCGADACAGGPPACTPDGLIEGCELNDDGFFTIIGPDACPAPGMVCVDGADGASCAFEGPFAIASAVEHYAAAAAPLAGAAVVWNTGGAIELGRYDADGLPLAPVASIGGAGAGARPAIAVPTSGPLIGQSVVVWHDEAGSAVRVRVVPLSGEAPAAFALPVKYALTPDASLASLGDPSGAIALRHELDGSGDARLFASQVDATSVAYSVEFGEASSGLFRGLAAAPDGASSFVAVWASGSETSSTLALRWIDLTGGKIDPVREVDVPEALSELSVCSHGATWLVAAERAFGSAVLGVGLASFEAGVEPLTVPWQTEIAGLVAPSLVCTEEGALLLGLVPESNALVGRKVLATGALAGQTVVFDASEQTSQPSGVRLTDGRLLLFGVRGGVLEARFWTP